MGEWFDADLVRTVAERLREWRIVLVGSNHLPASARRRLEGAPNIAFRGFMSYDRLPNELGTWDVAMIPFRLNDLTHATSPLKFFEYLAAGLPVVATPMRELLPLAHAGTLALCEDPASFASAAPALLEQADSEALVRRAWEHDWSRRFDFLLPELLKG
jgi:glycosyltransferase involved in cell wall biosynthesis